MFDALSFRPHNLTDIDAPMDLGALIEGMLFYGTTDVMLDSQTIRQIATFWSPDDLIALLDCELATFRYQQEPLRVLRRTERVPATNVTA